MHLFPKKKLYLPYIILLTLLYLTVLISFYEMFDFKLFALSLIPVIPAAWIYGWQAGMLAALTMVLLNVFVMGLIMDYELSYQYFFSNPLMLTHYLFLFMVGIIIGIVKQRSTELKETKDRLASTKKELVEINRIAPSGIFFVDNKSQIVDWNERAEQITGFKKKEVVGKKCTLFCSSCDIDKCRLFNNKMEKPFFGKKSKIRRKDGEERIVLKNAQLLKDSRGRVIGGIENFEDITEQVKVEDELRESLKRMEILYKASSLLISNQNLHKVLKIVVDEVVEALNADRVCLVTLDLAQKKTAHFVKGGPGLDKLNKIHFEELWQGLSGWVLRENKPALSLKSKPDPRESKELRQRRLKTDGGSIIVVPIIYQQAILGTITAINKIENQDFTQKDVDLTLAMANLAAGAIKNALLFRDLTESKRVLKKQATLDSLTGVLNRRMGLAFLENQLKTARRKNKRFIISFIDVDNMKNINDRYGHNEGDKLLITVCRLLKESVREVDILSRIGGDEFLLIFPECSYEEAVEIWKRIDQKIEEYNNSDYSREYKIGLSRGLAEYVPLKDISMEELIGIADKNMYRYKEQSKRNKYNIN